MKNRRRDPVTGGAGRQRSHQGHQPKSAPKEPSSARGQIGSQEASARQARIELAAIVESSDDAILSKDLNGTIHSWNKGAERIYGYSAAEMLGRHVSTLMPPDYPDDTPAIMQRLRRGERLEHYETLRQAKDGTVLNVSLTISPIHDESGAIIGSSTIARDITERKRSERELRHS